MRIRWFIEYQVKNIRPEQVAATAGGGIDKIENREQFQAVWRALGEYLGK